MTNMKKRISSLFLTHWIAIICGALFILFLFRNPFSTRTLIPNLEPFPDSFHYIVPAFSFLHGKGFVFEREGRTFKPSVPPLYSLVLSPLFAIVPDVRMFYFVNVTLAFCSFLLMYSIIRTLFSKKSIQFVVIILYVLSSPLNWFPQLAMAENLLLLLFLEGVLLLASPLKPRRLVIAGFLSVAFYATKYASLPLAVVFPLLYTIKLINSKKLSRFLDASISDASESRKISVRHWMYLFGSLFVFGGLYLAYEYFAKGNNVIGGLISLFLSVFFPKPAVAGEGGGGSFFATQFIAQNTKAYVGWLFGNPITVLWRQIVILPKYLAIPSMIGLFASLIHKKTRWTGVFLLVMLLSVIAFMSVFYAYDGRYFIIAIPTLFLGMGYFCSFLYETFPKKKRYADTFMLLLVAFILVMNAKQAKFTIGLNLKYAETPWYYLSIRTFDTYLHAHSNEFEKEPVVISPLPPYMIDAYADEKMLVLPLDPGQEFRSRLYEAWGDYDFEHLDSEYTRLLSEGHKVFLTKYGLGNEQFLQNRFAHLLEVFDARKVEEGCFTLCDIYELTPKKVVTR